MESNKIILGLDPGTNIMGYGLIQLSKNNIELIQYGVLNLKKHPKIKLLNWCIQRDCHISSPPAPLLTKRKSLTNGGISRINSMNIFATRDREISLIGSRFHFTPPQL